MVGVRVRSYRAWEWTGFLVGVLSLVGISLSIPARATEFDSPPEISHRKVVLDWQADADDPYYNGNTILEIDRRLDLIHPPGRAVKFIRLTGLSGLAYSYAAGADGIVEWRVQDGAVLRTLPLPGTEEPIGLTLHGSTAYVMATFRSGEVAIWDTRKEDPPEVYPVARQSLNRAIFFGGSVDPRDLRLITAGDSDTVRVWSDPRTVLYKLRVVDGPTYALDVDRRGEWIVTAGAGGRARVWQLSRPFAPRFQTNPPHHAPIRDAQITQDGTRMVTTDDSGQIRLWTFPNAVLIDSVDTGLASAPKLEFSVPSGAVLSVYLSDGRLQLYDGRNLRLYRERQISDAGGFSLDLAPDGRRSALGDGNGVITIARAGQCIPSLESPVCFGGYKIWRNTRPDTSGVRLLRVYGYGDSTWSFLADARSFSDPDSIIDRTQPPVDDPEAIPEDIVIAGPHDGVPYFYSITRFDRHFLNGSIFDVYPRSIMESFYKDPGNTEPTAIIPRPTGRAELPLLGEVIVVPNPYERGTVPWDAVGGAHVEFRNLPPVAKIAIHTVAGDQVRVLHHDEDEYGVTRSAESWDLRNGSGDEVAAGIYVYQVTTPSGEVIQGYFAVIH